MKSYLLLFLIAFGLAACQSETNNQEASGTVSDLGPTKAPPDTREARVLLKDFWVFEFIIYPNNRKRSLQERGRWYKFYADGTYENGHWKEQTGRGRWFLNYDYQFPILHLRAADPDQSWELQIQGVNEREDAMSWVSTQKYGQKGVMIKAISLLTRPTKKQFGVEE